MRSRHVCRAHSPALPDSLELFPRQPSIGMACHLCGDWISAEDAHMYKYHLMDEPELEGRACGRHHPPIAGCLLDRRSKYCPTPIAFMPCSPLSPVALPAVSALWFFHISKSSVVCPSSRPKATLGHTLEGLFLLPLSRPRSSL